MCANELTVRVDGLGIQPRLGRYRSFVVGLPHFLFLVRAVAPAMRSRLPYYGRGRARAIVFPASFSWLLWSRAVVRAARCILCTYNNTSSLRCSSDILTGRYRGSSIAKVHVCSSQSFFVLWS